MAIIKSGTDPKAWRKKKPKKKPVKAPSRSTLPGYKVPGSLLKPAPKPQVKAKPAAPVVFHPFVENMKNADSAYKEVHGKKPTAGQMYAMLSASPKGLSHPEWTQMLSVLDGSPDPVTNSSMKISVAYFNKFNAYPNASKMRAFLEAKNGLGEGDQDIGSVLGVLAGPTDTTDITLQGQAADKAGSKSGKRQWGWTQKDLDSMDGSKAKADAERKLANSTIHGDEMDQREIFDIMQARGWYLGTDFKGFIEARQASVFYNDDSTPNYKEVLGQSVVGGHKLDSILNANSYVKLREGAGGKPRSALSAKQKERLSAFAETLGRSDPSFWKYYNGKKKNLVWDEHFEAAAMQYIFLYAAPYAMSAPEEREGTAVRKGPRAQTEYGIPQEVVDNAMKLIEIASYGKIQKEDQLYQYLADQSTLGMRGDIRNPQDQVSGFKFFAFQKTAGIGMTDYQQISAYANTFGPDDLPQDARARYDNMTGTYSGLLNLLDHTPTNPFNDIFEALIGGKPVKQISLGPGLEPVRGLSPERLSEKWENKLVHDQNEAEMEQHRKDEILAAKPRGKAGVSHPSPHGDWATNVALPVMMDVLDSFDLAVDRAGMFLAMSTSLAISGGYLVEDGKGGWKRSGIEWNPTKPAFWTGKNEPTNRRNISSLHDVWHEAALATPEDAMGNTMFSSPFIRMLMRDYGVDPEQHKTILTIASIGREIAVGAVTDAWVVAGAKGVAKVSAKLSYKALSPALNQSVREAEKVVADFAEEAAAHYDPYKGITDAVTWGDYVDAKRKLSIINRPRWWDTHATALARGEQSAEVIDRILNINADQFHGAGEVGERLLKKREAIKAITKRIGESRDADEITHLFSELSFHGELLPGTGGIGVPKRPKWMQHLDERTMYGGYGVKLDPGTAMLNHAAKLEKGLRFSTVWDSSSQIIGDSGTILNGASSIRKHIESVGRALSAGGLDDDGVREFVNKYMTRAYELTGTTSHEIDLKRQTLWKEFMDEITGNLEKKSLSDAQANQLLYWAKRNALVSQDMTVAMFKKSIHNGDGEANWLDGVSVFSAIKNHQKRKGLGFNSKGAEKTFFDEYGRDPFLMPDPATGEGGQLAKNLYAPFSLQDMSAFIRGRVGWNLWQYTQGTALAGIPYGPKFIPSWMGLVNATKLLAIARMGFPLTAMLVDEIPRIPFEILNGRMSVNLGKWYKGVKLTKEAGKFDEMSSDLLQELMRDSDGMTAIDQSHPDYLLWLNGYTELLRKSAFTDDFLDFTSDEARAMLGKEAGEELNASEFREAFKEHLRELIRADDVVGERLRSYLIQAHHLKGSEFISPKQLAHEQEAWRQAVQASHNDYITLKTERNALRDERDALREKTTWEVKEETRDVVDEMMPEEVLPQAEDLQRQIDELSVQIDRLTTSPPTIEEIERMDIPVVEVPKWKSAQTTTVGPVDFERHYSATAKADEEVRRSIEKYYKKPTPENLAAARKKLVEKKEKALRSERVRKGKAAKDPILVKDMQGNVVVDNIAVFDQNIARLEKEIAEIKKLRPKSSSTRHDVLEHNGAEYTVESLGGRKWRIVSESADIDISGTFGSKAAARNALVDRISKESRSGSTSFSKSRRAQAAALKGKRTRLMKQKGTTPPPPSGARKDTITTFTEQGMKGLPNKPTNEFMEGFLDEHFPIAYREAVDLPADLADQLKVRIANLSDEEKEWAAREARQQYREEVVAARGLTDEYKQLNEINVRLKEMNAKVKEANGIRWKQQNHVKYPRSNLNAGAEDYLDAIIEKFDLYATFPALYKSLKNGTPISNKEMKGLLDYCDNNNLTLPIVPGVNQNGSNTVGRIPGLSEWAEGGLDAVPIVGKATKPLAKLPLLGKPAHFLTSLGPYNLLDKMSNMTRRTVYIGNFVKQYDNLIAAGFDESEALEVASRRAMDYADTAMYSPGMTPLESDLKGVVMFLPAYRQAAIYWAKAFARNPIVMTRIREAEGSEALMGWMGPYSQFIPTPFWTSGSSVAESVLPGLTMPLLFPLRVANTMTGFRKQADGTLKYTGATSLDWIGERIPFLSFMSKGVSPLSGVDDLLWGLWGEGSYLGAMNGQDHAWQAALFGIGIALRSDPEKKRRLAMNIMQAQISKGLKPNMTAAEAEIAGSPTWYRYFRDWFGMERPEGLLAFGTRTFGLGKINYTPNDLYDENTGLRFTGGKEGSLWEEFWGDKDVRSMADADWAMIQCYGDEKKMNALLDKFPKYKEVYKFRKKNAAQKQEYLIDPENLWITPYITGKNEYGIGGEMLSNADYAINRKAGIIMRKSVDDFLIDVQKTIDDVGWSKTYIAIDKEYQTNLTSSREMMMKWAKTSTNNPLTRISRQEDVLRYWNGWNGTQPGNLEESDVQNIPWWIQQAAKKAGFDPNSPNDRRKWDSGFVTAEYYNRLKAVESFSAPYNDGHVHLPLKEGERPYYSVTDRGAQGPMLAKGIEGKYTQGNIYNKDYTEGLGRMVRISTALDKLMPAKYKNLFSLSNSMSYGKIKQLLKDREARDKYYYRKIAGQPGYYFSDPAASLEAVGIEVKDHAALNNAWQKLQDRYDDYSLATKGMDTWGDKYLAIRARYINDIDKIYRNPALAVMKGGPAARLMQTYLGQSPDGINDKTVSSVVRGMMGTELPHPEELVDHITAPNKSKDPEQFLSAHAWRSVCLTAIAYRQKLRTSWNDSMDSNGSSPDSKLGKKYSARLLTLVRAWTARSKHFRSQWEMVGGDESISAWLDYAN